MERSGLDPGRDGEPARWSVLGLDPRPDVVARVRRAARAVLGLWDRDVQEPEMSLLLSEVVTNAVRHAGTVFDVTLIMDGDTVRCEVRDGSPRMPHTGHPGPQEAGGRGLLLVEALSTAWGVEFDGTGKRVWFELPSVHVGPALVHRSRVVDGPAPPHPAVVVLPVDRPVDVQGPAFCEPRLP
jgi:anti-sigma regulatory factor (Ser/Thr protein kinase)